MILNNPYTEELHNAYREYDKSQNPDILKNIEELDLKSRAYVQEYISKFDSKIEKIREQANSVAKDIPSKRQQYEKLKQLYREAMKLAKDISLTKKEMREGK